MQNTEPAAPLARQLFSGTPAIGSGDFESESVGEVYTTAPVEPRPPAHAQVRLASYVRVVDDITNRWNHGDLLTLRNNLCARDDPDFLDPLLLGFPPAVTDFSGGLESPNVVISHEPLSSTGDAYHILAYCCLAASIGYNQPQIRPSSQKVGSSLAADKSRAMLSAMMIEVGETVSLPPTLSSRSNTLRFELRRFFRDSPDCSGTFFVDQKALTTILSAECIKYGHNATMLHIWKQFDFRFRSIDNGKWIAAGKYAQKSSAACVNAFVQSVRRLKKATLVVINARVGGEINTTQSLLHFQVSGLLKACLDNPDNYVVLLEIGGSPGSGGSLGSLSTAPFFDARRVIIVDPFDSTLVTDEATRCHDEKIAHLSVIHVLRSAMDYMTIRIVGNTSGTLDILSFVGLPVLNLHLFSDKGNYQDYRVLEQLAWSSVIPRIASNWKSAQETVKFFIASDVPCYTVVPPTGITWNFPERFRSSEKFVKLINPNAREYDLLSGMHWSLRNTEVNMEFSLLCAMQKQLPSGSSNSAPVAPWFCDIGKNISKLIILPSIFQVHELIHNVLRGSCTVRAEVPAHEVLRVLPCNLPRSVSSETVPLRRLHNVSALTSMASLTLTYCGQPWAASGRVATPASEQCLTPRVSLNSELTGKFSGNT